MQVAVISRHNNVSVTVFVILSSFIETNWFLFFTCNNQVHLLEYLFGVLLSRGAKQGGGLGGRNPPPPEF